MRIRSRFLSPPSAPSFFRCSSSFFSDDDFLLSAASLSFSAVVSFLLDSVALFLLVSFVDDDADDFEPPDLVFSA